MLLIQRLAEEKIQAALDRGDLDNLPGQGKPLNLDDDRYVPEELRAGFRLLKNAGYLPPELEIKKEIQQVEALLLQVESEPQEQQLIKRLNLLRMQLLQNGHDVSLLIQEDQYRQKLLEKITHPDSQSK